MMALNMRMSDIEFDFFLKLLKIKSEQARLDFIIDWMDKQGIEKEQQLYYVSVLQRKVSEVMISEIGLFLIVTFFGSIIFSGSVQAIWRLVSISEISLIEGLIYIVLLVILIAGLLKVFDFVILSRIRKLRNYLDSIEYELLKKNE